MVLCSFWQRDRAGGADDALEKEMRKEHAQMETERQSESERQRVRGGGGRALGGGGAEAWEGGGQAERQRVLAALAVDPLAVPVSFRRRYEALSY